MSSLQCFVQCGIWFMHVEHESMCGGGSNSSWHSQENSWANSSSAIAGVKSDRSDVEELVAVAWG